MGGDWAIYAVALAALAVVWSIVLVIPALLVRFRVISGSEPVVLGERPTARDWLLTFLCLASMLVLIVRTNPSDIEVIIVATIYFIAGPWWIWRSFKSVLYAKQHIRTLSSGKALALLLSNAFFYTTAYWLVEYLR